MSDDTRVLLYTRRGMTRGVNHNINKLRYREGNIEVKELPSIRLLDRNSGLIFIIHKLLKLIH